MSYSEYKCVCGDMVVIDYADGMCTVCCIKKLKNRIACLEAENKRLKEALKIATDYVKDEGRSTRTYLGKLYDIDQALGGHKGDE